MTAICVIGIELSARTQVGLLGAEIITLALFAVVALSRSTRATRRRLARAEALVQPVRDRLDSTALVAACCWRCSSTGAGTARSASTRRPRLQRGRARRAIATVILLGIYVLVADRGDRLRRHAALSDESDDVLGLLAGRPRQPLDKILIIAVLTSAAASTQTTILPTRAPRSRWPARARCRPRSARPPALPDAARPTILMGACRSLWYVGLTIVSENILFDSIAALGLMIAFYYGLTGFACAIYYRRELIKSAKNFLLIGVAPVLGGGSRGSVKSIIDLPTRELRVRRLLARPRPAAGHRRRPDAVGVVLMFFGTPRPSRVLRRKAESPIPARDRRAAGGGLPDGRRRRRLRRTPGAGGGGRSPGRRSTPRRVRFATANPAAATSATLPRCRSRRGAPRRAQQAEPGRARRLVHERQPGSPSSPSVDAR